MQFFGCVLYDMLTGNQAFKGDTVSDILAAVLAREPDYALLPANLNPKVADLLRRALDKNPKRRWYSVSDLRFEIEAALAAPAVNATGNLNVPIRHKGRVWPTWTVAALAIVAFAVLLIRDLQRTPNDLQFLCAARIDAADDTGSFLRRHQRDAGRSAEDGSRIRP